MSLPLHQLEIATQRDARGRDELSSAAVQKYNLQIRYSENEERGIPSALSVVDSWDAWRHYRMYADLLPVLNEDPAGSWLTIGDNGADAHYIRANGKGRIIASSISRVPLDLAVEAGFLKGVEVEAINAETIDLPAGHIDYVYCKEAYHHFARPPIGLYEFMRVARKAVILCEPSDQHPPRLFDRVRSWVKFVLRGERLEQVEFEEAGNFIFRVSTSELRKMAIALGCSRVYWHYFNDFFIKKLARQPQSNSFAGFALKLGIFLQDISCKMRLMNWGKCTVIIWMREPDQQIDSALRKSGFARFDVPVNPYV